MVVILSSIAKYFFKTFGSIYCFSKILHITPTRKDYRYAFIFSLISAPLLESIRHNFSFLFLYVALICVTLFCYRLSPAPFKRIPMILCLSMLSFSINYALSLLSLVIICPFFYYFFTEYITTITIKTLTSLLSGVLQLCLVYLLFRIPRLKKGIPDIEKNFSDEIFLVICMPVFFLTALFSSDTNARYIVLFALYFLATFCIILYLWWRKYVANNYLYKAQSQTIRILENTIAKQNEELEKLSKIIHKDNKLIGALHASVQELYNTTNLPEGLQLKKELESLSQERKGLLHTYETSGEHLPKTNVFSTDVIISYLYKRALEKEIHFDVMLSGDIRYMTENVLEESLLNTLLADLGENAIIATSNSEKRNILLSIGVREHHYFIDFFDSGAAFDARVIENLGKRRYTTHKDEGGSGIGLMTTFELLKAKKGSFELEEFQQNNLFTKRVSVIFDSRDEVRIRG